MTARSSDGIIFSPSPFSSREKFKEYLHNLEPYSAFCKKLMQKLMQMRSGENTVVKYVTLCGFLGKKVNARAS